MGQFLSDLTVTRHVAASTQNPAWSAMVFLYQEVLGQEMRWVDDVVRAKKPRKLPVVLTQEEVNAVLHRLSGTPWWMARLLHGSGLRLMECLRLWVKDVDFAYHQIVVREGKGDNDRVTVLPLHVTVPLPRHLQSVHQLHDRHWAEGFGCVYLPEALESKYAHANREWAWHYVFPAARRSRDPRSGMERRHHVRRLMWQRAVQAAVRQAGITKAASWHTFRHAWATHRLEAGYDIRTVHELLGPQDVNTTMIYPHVLNRGGRGVRSPGDLLCACWHEGEVTVTGLLVRSHETEEEGSVRCDLCRWHPGRGHVVVEVSGVDTCVDGVASRITS